MLVLSMILTRVVSSCPSTMRQVMHSDCLPEHIFLSTEQFCGYHAGLVDDTHSRGFQLSLHDATGDAFIVYPFILCLSVQPSRSDGLEIAFRKAKQTMCMYTVLPVEAILHESSHPCDAFAFAWSREAVYEIQ